MRFRLCSTCLLTLPLGCHPLKNRRCAARAGPGCPGGLSAVRATFRRAFVRQLPFTRIHAPGAPVAPGLPAAHRVPGGHAGRGAVLRQQPAAGRSRRGTGPRGACADRARRMLRSAAGPQMWGEESPAPFHPRRRCRGTAGSWPSSPIKFVKKKS